MKHAATVLYRFVYTPLRPENTQRHGITDHIVLAWHVAVCGVFFFFAQVPGTGFTLSM